MTTTLLEAGRKVLDHLNARIDNADRSEAIPVFDGIAELHAAVHAAEADGAGPIYICLATPADVGGIDVRIRAWTLDPIRAEQMTDNGLLMQPFYAQPDALRGALAGLVEAVRRDADEGGKGISGYTGARLADAKAMLGGFPAGAPAAPEWHRDLIDREPDHGQYAKGGNANAAPSSLEEWIKAEFTGHGVAIRKQTDAPIPGEPFMSMADAKDLVRRAVQIWPTEVQWVETLERIAEIIRDETRTTDSGVIHNSTDVARMILERTARTATIVKAPPGWKLVPIEPTEAMLAAHCARSLDTDVLLDDTRFACDRAGYEAALKAAPKPPL